ncbi:MAG: HD-GYP domain-containing protein [Tissierella sp.]|uniref:HD-GYP domain-containing protein n=1 Tax=Tissierella sp. TaxID=41274 RepID=UPI003F9CEE64
MKPNKKTYKYIFSMFFIAIALITYLFLNFEMPSIGLILFWTAMSIIVETLPIILPNNNMAVSVGSAINLSAVMVGGPILAAISYPLGVLFRFPYVAHRKSYRHIFNTPYYMTMFNVSQSVIISSVTGLVYIYSGGKVGGFFLLQIIYMLVAGTLLNTVTISGLMTFLQGENFIKIWINNIKGVIWSALAIGVMGVIIALSFISYGYLSVILFFAPLLLARHSFKLYVEMRSFNIATIETLSKALEAKDPYTSGHSTRVGEYALLLANAYGLSKKRIDNLMTAAVLHDIGKIGIKDSILHKTDRLTREEFDQIRNHPAIGADILSKIDTFKEVEPIVRYHHEKYDGSGYPEGLKGDEVPIEAYILAIADSFDAMTSDRSYRDGLDIDVACKEIEKNAGRQFHPELAKCFIKTMNRKEVADCF